jgi:hypothetical protein
MRTLTPSAPARSLWQDVRLLYRIGAMVLQYWVEGGRLRRAYRRCEARGCVLWLDALGPTRHREASLHQRQP